MAIMSINCCEKVDIFCSGILRVEEDLKIG